jgi:hypothetical protein
MVLLFDMQKAFAYPFMIKTLSELGIMGNVLHWKRISAKNLQVVYT